MIFTDKITVTSIQQVGGDEMIVAAAKVSTSGEDAKKFAKEDPKNNFGLINYLMRQKHGSPFEHGLMTIFVHAPIFVFREWMRHRIGFSYNEESGRYKKLEPVFWIPNKNRKIVPVDGYKPSRPEFRAAKELEYSILIDSLKNVYTQAYQTYNNLIESGLAKEVCRACLPVGIYSSCWITCNPRSLMSFLSLRTHEPEAKFVSYPQAEIEEAARMTEEILKESWPLTYRAYVENGRVSP